MGTKGHAVVDDLVAALHGWCGLKGRAIEYVLKGHNMLTEHYRLMHCLKFVEIRAEIFLLKFIIFYFKLNFSIAYINKILHENYICVTEPRV